MSKNGWDKHQKHQPSNKTMSNETISNAEFELYDLLRNMMMLTFLISMILVIMGKLGLK
jgi:cytochrome bd-type quinol oxidase subunit 2